MAKMMEAAKAVVAAEGAELEVKVATKVCDRLSFRLHYQVLLDFVRGYTDLFNLMAGGGRGRG